MHRRIETAIRRGFTLIELLVAVTILASLVSMAAGVFVVYLRESDEKILRYNLATLRAALQQFYLDHGRYPFDDRDFFGNRVAALDNHTSELVQGVFVGEGIYPEQRYRYLQEIPIDPTTNLANWYIYPHDTDGDWDPNQHDLAGSGVPNRGEPNVEEDPIDGIDNDDDGLIDEDPPDVRDVRSSNPDFAHY